MWNHTDTKTHVCMKITANVVDTCNIQLITKVIPIHIFLLNPVSKVVPITMLIVYQYLTEHYRFCQAQPSTLTESGKFKLARWSQKVVVFPKWTTHPPTHHIDFLIKTSTGWPKKSVPQNRKREVFFTETVCQGMKLITWVKSNRPRVPRSVEMMNFIKIYSEKESETNG